MVQGIRDYGGIEPQKAGLVTGRTVYSSGAGQGITGIFLEIFDGMNGILACPVDMTGTAVNCAVMFLSVRMTNSTE